MKRHVVWITLTPVSRLVFKWQLGSCAQSLCAVALAGVRTDIESTWSRTVSNLLGELRAVILSRINNNG